MKTSGQTVKKLTDFLRDRESATYAEMNRRTGKEIDGVDRYVLYGALRDLKREGISFATERGKGLRKAAADAQATVAVAQTKRIRVRSSAPVELSVPRDQDDFQAIGMAVARALDATIGQKLRTQIATKIRNGQSK